MDWTFKSCINVPNHLLSFIHCSNLAVVINCKGVWETCIGLLSWKGRSPPTTINDCSAILFAKATSNKLLANLP